MIYSADHDYHIHSQLSLCSNDPAQSVDRILQYAKDNSLSEICLTDHFWDESVPLPAGFGFYEIQNCEHIKKALPLPQDENVKFLFGCETDLLADLTLGISRSVMEEMDFIIIPTTHLHFAPFNISIEDMNSLDRIAMRWIERFDAVLNMDLPFHKVGLAHLTTQLIANAKWEDHTTVLRIIPDSEKHRLFEKAAKKGIGIELNFSSLSKYSPCDYQTVFDVYRIAKDEGCKFYLGTDAHHPSRFDTAVCDFKKWISELDLKQSDRFRINHN